LDINGAGTFNIVGNASAGSVGSGFSTATGSATINMTGNCIGSNSSGQAFGCVNTNAATFTLTGNLISGLKGGAYYGAIIYTPAASNYTLYAKDSSYTLNTINTHSTLMPTDPGVSNVKSGVVYGAGTGTYGGGAGLCDTGGW
jgi:hypothetical protein